MWKFSTSLNFDVKFGVGKSLVCFRRPEDEEMEQEGRRYVNCVDSVTEKLKIEFAGNIAGWIMKVSIHFPTN